MARSTPSQSQMRRADIDVALWKWQGCILAGGTPDDFKRFAKDLFDADLDVGAHSAAHAYLAYGKPFLIWVESLDNIPALAHEALHVTFGMLELRGLKPTPDSEEAYTYTMETILRSVITTKKWKLVR